MLRDFAEAALALGAVQRKDRQAGRETRGLVLPVEDERGRQDDQRRTVEAAALLLQQQVRQRLHRLAQAHVVGKYAGQILFAQELQPGQPLALIAAQIQAEPGRRVDMRDALRRRQLVGQPEHVALATELPASRIVEIGQARRVETRETQGGAVGETFEQVDEGRGDRLQAAGRGANALVGWRAQLYCFVIGDLLQQDAVQPAVVTTEERGEQGRQRQALAFDDDAHVEVEPAVVGLDQFGVPGVDFQRMVTEVFVIFDLPAGAPQFGQVVLHE